MWVAYFQADGDVRHTIAVTKYEHQAELKRVEFVARIPHPEVGVWFTWVEETDEQLPS